MWTWGRNASHWLILALQVASHQFVPALLMLAILLMTLQSDVAQSYSQDAILDRMLNGEQFDFLSWELHAILAKTGQEITQSQLSLSDTDRITLVRGYMRRAADFEHLEDQINQIYIDPAIHDPLYASAGMRAQRDQLRREIEVRQNIVEAILEEQVQSVLREEGFSIGGQVMPPLRFRFTPLPYVIIISRRDKIERIDQRELTTGLSVDDFDRIERTVDRRLNVSSLVTPIGGLGAYPTMLPENSSLRYTLETAAHEWTHNYLEFSPVGLRYNSNPVARAINETTAVIVQNEVGLRVLQRFYPDLVPPIQPPTAQQSQGTSPKRTDQPPPFDFNKEMRETRVHTDDLLAAGKIEEAEAYMEARRVIFVQNGYSIRKLNQAYFAFYGAYNAEPGGAPTAGRDPIGPAVQALRQHSTSIGDFVRKIATVTSLQDVQRLAGQPGQP